MSSIYSFTLKSIDGQKLSLSEYKNKIILIVNVASKCGFTSQYKELEDLYEKYKNQDFIILGIPCNQFGSQEPGSNEEIVSFCQLTYNVSFPMFSKIKVNGKNADPLYKFLRQERKGFLGSQTIKWNFTKFLINKEGEVLERFAPASLPSSFEHKIQELM
ncbi:glutathione peroxidase [Sulfurimonas sp. MAG313]|nr:glutathione peroxidase [Sulfurimonas sp. MAG313]MDF1881804.1 glutathione peroxidase [Sulfurimonas sp. MAG313]